MKSKFSVRFQDFQHIGPTFSFLIKPENFEESDLDLSLFEWMKIGDLEMQLIDFKLFSLWVVKFTELRKTLETTASDHEVSILSCWTSLPEKFDCMKKDAFALSPFGTTYLCEQIFSHVNILNPHRSRLTTKHSEGCVQLKVSRYTPDIATLSKGKQGQGSH
ncbi:hypothetical protein Hamer_G003317 [Homarus americanus]|uniref:Uncharacterized protein n=1 Tax=Homarus americanus TaxID=6706 RepID=A0A8J5TKY3_HOMAM|nr:hypothetical protein Hamer_G003317 [Homarus americanus]